MSHNQQAQNPSKIGNPSQDSMPSWVIFHLKKFDKVTHTAGVIMGHHLVVVITSAIVYRDDQDIEDGRNYTANLLAFNLEDHSIQEAKIYAPLLARPGGDYSFLKYGENQIIKYASEFVDYGASMVKCEAIEDDNEGRFCDFNAQIYKDCFYIYGRVEDEGNEMWSFDLKNHTWKFYETTGEAPSEPSGAPCSFIYQDNLCIYRSYSCPDDLFMLDFKSMTWKKIAQQETYLRCFDGAVYQDHFIALEYGIKSKKNTLYSLNLDTKNTWSTFDITTCMEWDGSGYAMTGGLMTYKNLILGLETLDNDQELILAIMNIENLGILALRSAEDEEISALFMSQTGSDIAFKVDEKVIPAHKGILMKKSRYFEILFNSGMAESTQDVIEIKDCDGYEIFKEYLRWIYQGTVDLNDSNQAIKLHVLADKYLQDDLREKCVNSLASFISMENVYTILDFANQENSTYLKSWCLKCIKDEFIALKKGGLRDSLDLYVADLIKYLDRQEDLDWKENNSQLRKFAFDFVLDIFEKEKNQTHEDMLLKIVEVNTIAPLIHFLSRAHAFSEKPDWEKNKKEAFEKVTTRLKEAAFRFIEGNAKVIMASPEAKDFPNDFFRDFLVYTTENLSNTKAENQALKSEKKGMEPDHDGSNEENHELKKTKK